MDVAAAAIFAAAAAPFVISAAGFGATGKSSILFFSSN